MDLPISSSSVKVSLGKVEHEAGEKETYSFPLTNLRNNLIISIEDSEGNQLSNSGVRTMSIVEKGTWDDEFPIEGGGLIHMKLEFILSDEERKRIRLMTLQQDLQANVGSHPFEELWVGHGSRAAEEKQYFDSHLTPFYRIEQLLLATKPQAAHEKSPTIVTEENIKLLFEIQAKVDGIRANYSGSLVSLTDICMKPLGAACATQSILQYFKMDPKNYDGLGGVGHAEYCFQHYTSDENCMSAFKGPLDPSTAL